MPPVRDRRAALAAARLYLLLTRASCVLPPLDVLQHALDGGCDLVQVREPGVPDDALAPWVRDVRRVAAARGVPVIVNDRPHVALDAGADGVHIGHADMEPVAARVLLGPDLLIGFSAHAAADLHRARALGVDYCGLGPVFDTGTKDLAGLGSTWLRDALPHASTPTFAIGGITPGNVRAVAAAGATRVAVSGAICGASDPAAAARAILQGLRPHPESSGA